MKTYYVYLMASISRTLYVGVTNDLARRVQEHKSGEGSGFTRRYNVKKLVWYETFNSINDAIAIEMIDVDHCMRMSVRRPALNRQRLQACPWVSLGKQRSTTARILSDPLEKSVDRRA